MSLPLETIVGSGQIESSSGESLDGVKISAVVRPGAPEEVAACLRAARDAGLALVVSAGGTKLGWGNLPRASSLVRLDLSRLAEKLEIQPDEGIATVSAGVPVATLARELEAVGKTSFLSDPFVGATVGGSVASDPIGPLSTPARSLRGELLGMQVALCTGDLTRAGGRVVKNVTGFDLVRLYCGSLGTLGVITEVTLRLRPRPELGRVLVREVGDLQSAVSLATELDACAVEASGALIVQGPERARLLWLVEGPEDDVEERAARLPADASDLEDWEGAAAGLAARPDGAAVVRVSGRPGDLLAILAALVPVAGASGILASLPQLGVVRSAVEPSELPALLERCGHEGWGVLVEHASPEVKAELDVFGALPSSFPIMRALKAQFDPLGTLAPGRFIGRL